MSDDNATIDDQPEVTVDPDDLPDWPNWDDDENGAGPDGLPAGTPLGPEDEDEEG